MRRLTIAIAIALTSVGCGGGLVPQQTGSGNMSATTFSAERPPPAPPPTTSSAAPTPSVPAGIGETVAVQQTQYDNSAGSVTLHGVTRVLETDSPLSPIPDNGSYLVIDVTVTTISGSLSANPFGWAVQTADSRTYDAALGAVSGQIDSSEIPAGQERRGNVAFDVPNQPGLITIWLKGALGAILVEFQVTI